MERHFNNEFERFLKENANQYRLYPSPKVWKGIHAALHTRRKWFGLGIVLLLLTGLLITLLITNSSKQATVAVNNPASIITNQSSASHINIFEINKSTGSIQAKNNLVPFDQNIALSKATKDIVSNKIRTAEENIFQNPDFNANVLTNPGNTGVKNIQNTENFKPLIINITDELTDEDFINTSSLQKTSFEQKQLPTLNSFNWTIESVLNSYASSRRNKRIGFQLNFTPTISYRKLSENKAFMRTAAAQNNPFYVYTLPQEDVNSAVTHKPDMGLELGFTAKYSLASNFKAKAGLQFNINRYEIKTFNTSTELATIMLNNRNGIDSVNTATNYNNISGYKSNWLQNFYFQISLPVGIEMKLAGDDKIQLGVAGTIQPTYLLGDRAYLISTDYKNYVQVPNLIRRWNVNTNFETFVSYSTGHLKWQVGPQVRYQLLSSFVDKYPVKENLFDFGLKVGISLNNQ